MRIPIKILLYSLSGVILFYNVKGAFIYLIILNASIFFYERSRNKKKFQEN